MSGAANTGGGGGGGSWNGLNPGNADGAAGGSGIVIVRYAGEAGGITGGTVTAGTGTATGYTLHTFTNVGSGTLDFSAVNFSERLGVTVTGVISGSGDFIYVGPGRLTLAGANTYEGRTVVENGTLQAGSTAAFGLCPEIVLSNTAGATLDLNNIDYTIKSLAGGGADGGNVLLGSATLSIGCNNGGSEYAGSISGTGGIIKIGTDTQTFSGTNTYTGGTRIDAGVLAVTTIADSGPSALGNSGTLLLNGGTLRYTGTTQTTTARLVDISLSNTTSAIDVSEASGHLILTGNVWNSDVTHSNVVLNKTGVGTLEIAGEGRNVGLSLDAREGTTLLNGNTNTIYEIRALDTNATVKLLRPNQVFSGDAIPTTGNIRMTGGTLDLNGFNQTVNRLTGAEFGTFGTGVITSTAPATFTFGSSLAGRPSDFAGTIEGALNVVTRGSNKVTLAGDNTYSGTTTISNANGTLQIGTNGTTGTLGAGSVSNNGTLVFFRSDDLPVANDISGSGRLVQQGAGTVTLTGANTYSGTTTITNGALQIGDGGTSGTLGTGAVINNGTLIVNRSDEVVVANTISGSGGLIQTGAGTTTLTGTNSYTGTTAIDVGTLLLDGNHLSGASYTVAGGATFGGGGLTDSSVLVDGTIRPGDGTTQGILQTGDLSLNNTGLLNILLGGATSSLLSVTGDISLLGGIDFTVGPALTADLYPLITYTGSLSGTFSLTNNPPTGFNLVYGTNNTIFLERVPTIDGAAVLSQGDALITGGSLPFGVLVYNNSTNSPVDFALSAGTDTTGSFGPTNIAAGGDINAQGLAYTGTNIGTNTGTYVLTNVTAGTATTNTLTVQVYDHAAGSISTNMIALPDVIVGYGTALSDTLTASNATGFRVGMDSVSVSTNSNFTVTDVANVAPGASASMQVVLQPGQGPGIYNNVINVSFSDHSTLPGATNNLTPTNFTVTGTVFDHAAALVANNTIAFAPVHAGYTAALTNALAIANEDGVRVAMQTANTITNSLFSLGTVTNLAPGASAQLAAALQPGQPVGQFTNTVVISYGDDSTLDGALAVVGTTNILVTGYVYSGQSTWTNNGTGSWTDFASWDVPGGTPGLDGVLSVNDTATFGAAGSGTVVLDTNASVLEVVFSNSSASYTVNGSGTLIMAASGTNNPTIANQAGSHVIAAAISLADSTSFNISPGADLSVSGVVSGPGAIDKTGGGTLLLGGNNTYTGGTALNAGTLVAASPTALGRGEVKLSAGTLSIQTALEVSGLTWNSNATIAIPNPSAGHFVNVSGDLNLLGPGQHFFDLSGATVNSPVKLLAAPGLADNELSIFGFRGLDDDAYELAYIGDELWLVLISPPVPPAPDPEKPKYPDFTQFAVNPNQFQVAQALNQWVASGPSGDRKEVLDALVASGDYRRAFDAMMPAIYASLPAMAFNQANALNSGMFQRLWVIRINGQGFSSMGLEPAPLQQGKSVVPAGEQAWAVDPPRDTKWGTFVDGNGIFASGGEVANLQNYRSQSGGVNAGASYKWTDTLATGVYVGYQGLQAQYDNGQTTDNAVRFGVFGTYEVGGLYFNALAGGAYHDYTVERDIQFGTIDRTATGRPGAGEFDLALGTGYDFKAGDFTFGPFMTMQYTYLGVQGFKEKGADSLNLDVDSYDASSLLYTLGAQVGYNWKVSSAIIITPTLFAGWQHEFLQDAYRINASFNTAGPSAPFGYNTGTPARDNFYGGAGVTLGLGGRWQATAIYSAFVGGDLQNSQNVYLGLGLNF